MVTFKQELNTEIGGFLVGDKIMFKTKSQTIPKFLKAMPAGTYEVNINVKPTSGIFAGRDINKKGMIVVESGHVFIGDPSAVHRTFTTWHKFLDENKLLSKKPMKHGLFIDVSGDGKGIVTVELKKKGK